MYETRSQGSKTLNSLGMWPRMTVNSWFWCLHCLYLQRALPPSASCMLSNYVARHTASPAPWNYIYSALLIIHSGPLICLAEDILILYIPLFVSGCHPCSHTRSCSLLAKSVLWKNSFYTGIRTEPLQSLGTVSTASLQAAELCKEDTWAQNDLI